MDEIPSATLSDLNKKVHVVDPRTSLTIDGHIHAVHVHHDNPRGCLVVTEGLKRLVVHNVGTIDRVYNTALFAPVPLSSVTHSPRVAMSDGPRAETINAIQKCRKDDIIIA